MEAMLKSILLATDGSEEATLAARAAAQLSKKFGAELVVAHAWRPLTQRAGYPAVIWTDYAHLYEREARRVISTQVEAVEALGCSIEEARLLQGPPVDAILDLCEEIEPDLVVVGSRGLGSLRRLLLGSVSEGIVHHARCPVLVVRGGEEAWPPQRVVVGDDGSEDSGRAAKLALGIGSIYEAGSVLVRAYRNPPEPVGGWSASDRRRLDDARVQQEESAKKRAQEIGQTLENASEVRVVHGEPAAAILGVAAQEDARKTLLAVGSRGLGALSRARLGSVSTKVLRAAEGPVLICPRSTA